METGKNPPRLDIRNPVHRCLITLFLCTLLLFSTRHPFLGFGAFAFFLPLFWISGSRVYTPVTLCLALSIGVGLAMASPVFLILANAMGRWYQDGGGGRIEEAAVFFLLLTAFVVAVVQSFVFRAYGFQVRLSVYFFAWLLVSFIIPETGFVSFIGFGAIYAYLGMMALARVKTKSKKNH